MAENNLAKIQFYEGTDEPVVPEGCDFVIGLTDDGMAFDNTDLSIAVGETVCWIWNDAAMAHNVAQIREEGDTTRDVAGEYSGAAATNVDQRPRAVQQRLVVCQGVSIINLLRNGAV